MVLEKEEQQEQEVPQKQEQEQEQEVPQEQDEKEGVDVLFHPSEEEIEPAAKKRRNM